VCRWYIPSSPRSVNISVPTISTVLQLSGLLLGRQAQSHPPERQAPLAITLMALEYLPVRPQPGDRDAIDGKG
jgi:hypothetical protein